MSNAQSKFVKQVLVEEGEYDRLRQQSFRDYSPQIRAMVKLQENIVATMLRKDLDPQQKLDLISGPQQRFNTLREETNTLNGDTIGKSSTSTKANAVPKEEKTEATGNKAKEEPMVVKNEPVKIVAPPQADKLMDLIGNNPNIIRRNDENEMEVNGHAVPGTNFDDLYAALLSPTGSQNMVGMPEMIGALRQLNVESKDIVSNAIKAAYDTPPPRSGPLRHNEMAIPKAPKPTPKTKPETKNKRKSQPQVETEETAPSKHATRATTKYNMPRNKQSNVDKPEQSGKGISFPTFLYVYP